VGCVYVAEELFLMGMEGVVVRLIELWWRVWEELRGFGVIGCEVKLGERF
jgi:hypothetical protein